MIIRKLLPGFIMLVHVAHAHAQDRQVLGAAQERALQALAGFDTTAVYPLWPNVSASGLCRNLRANVLYPEKIYQGHSTNFCGYSALTVLFCKQQPDIYVRLVLDLYTKGRAEINGTVIRPSAAVRAAAGALPGKGKLVLNEADQLWLMALPDHFKSYMNIDRKYKPGDENKIWAACTLGKFNRMARAVGGYEVKSRGTDLVRPGSGDMVGELQEALTSGTVVLYVNSKYLHPSKFRIFTLRAPTHYIILYDIKKDKDVVVFTYWDYGLKTLELISPKRVKKMTFGIVRLHTS
jgi:hypothetical protein